MQPISTAEVSKYAQIHFASTYFIIVMMQSMVKKLKAIFYDWDYFLWCVLMLAVRPLLQHVQLLCVSLFIFTISYSV